MRLLPILLSLSMLLFSRCALAEDTGIPSEVAKDKKELWRQLMNKYYGQHDSKKKCWASPVRNQEESYCYRPYILRSVTRQGATDYYMVVAGEAEFSGHSCPGSADFLLLSDRRPTLELSAIGRSLAVGLEFCSAPPIKNFQLTPLGNGNFQAWAVVSGTVYQGYGYEQENIVALVGHEFRIIADFSRRSFNSGALNPNDKDYTDYAYTLTFGGINSKEEFAPIQMELEGIRKGKPVGGTMYATFSTARGKYLMPERYISDSW